MHKLNVKRPWLQAPMYRYSNPELVAACCDAGILGSLPPSPSITEFESNIQTVKSKTKNAFAVNIFLFPKALDENQLDMPLVVKDKLNVFRTELGIPHDPVNSELGNMLENDLDLRVEIILKNKVPAVIFTFGLVPRTVVEKLHAGNVFIFGSCTSLKEALEWQELGVDAVIMQGVEAGGHRTSTQLPIYGTTGLFSLLQTSREHIKIPIIAAGGLSTGKAVNAAMTLGADAVSIGTLFLSALEASTPQSQRDLLKNLNPTAQPVISRLFTGRPAQMLPNRYYIELVQELNKAGLSEQQVPWNLFARDIFKKAGEDENNDLIISWGGQSVALLAGKGTRTAAEIINELAKDSV